MSEMGHRSKQEILERRMFEPILPSAVLKSGRTQTTAQQLRGCYLEVSKKGTRMVMGDMGRI